MALALLWLPGWASQEQFPAISRPGESRFLPALLTMGWPAHLSWQRQKGSRQGRGVSHPPRRPPTFQIPAPSPHGCPLRGKAGKQAAGSLRGGLCWGEHRDCPAGSRVGHICTHCPLLAGLCIHPFITRSSLVQPCACNPLGCRVFPQQVTARRDSLVTISITDTTTNPWDNDSQPGAGHCASQPMAIAPLGPHYRL